MNIFTIIHINSCNSKEEKLKIILDTNDPEVCFNFSFLFEQDIKSLNLLSEIVLYSGKEYYIERFYKLYNFDKSKYESYFRNLVFK